MYKVVEKAQGYISAGQSMVASSSRRQEPTRESSSGRIRRQGARHPASLLPYPLHDETLLRALSAAVDDAFIAHVADRALAIVPSAEEPEIDTGSSGTLLTPPPTPVKGVFVLESPPKHAQTSSTPNGRVPSLQTFIYRLAAHSNAQAPTLAVALLYMERLRKRLIGARAAKGMPCTYHRLFLASLIAAAKYCNDCGPRNKHWSQWSGLFGMAEINLMEHELLVLLDYQLRFDEEELLDACRFLST